jgi:hypothetical protein
VRGHGHGRVFRDPEVVVSARHCSWILTLLVAAAVSAQPGPVSDPDDSVDPRQRVGTLFISRLIIGAAFRPVDHYRPLHQNIASISVANNLYWSDFEFAYKHTETRGREHGPAAVHVCECDERIYFPTPPSPDSTPAAPLPGSRDTIQIAWYHAAARGSERPAVMLRSRATFTHQALKTVVRSAATDRIVSRLSGQEQSFGLETDTYLRIHGRDVHGALFIAKTARSGTTDNRSQTELGYKSLFPAMSIRNVLLRPTFTVGGVSNRGGTAINVLNPVFEAFWHDRKTRANVRLVWSPLMFNDGTAGWRINHQIALSVDRSLYVKAFLPRGSR